MLLRETVRHGRNVVALLAMAIFVVLPAQMHAQEPRGQMPPTAPLPPSNAQAPSTNSYAGSVVREKAAPGILPLSLDQAIQMGLKNNLGAILSATNAQASHGEKLQQLQNLLPTVIGTAQDTVSQVNLQAQGLRVPGFPTIIGPFAYTDFRATLNQAVLNVTSIQNYLASKHSFAASQYSAADAGDMIVLTVGNAYLRCLADDALVTATESQVGTSKISLDQAIQNHQNGVSPRLDELRARVDYQTQEQALIAAKNADQKDRIALARAIGLPLNQQFELADKAPYAEMNVPRMDVAMAEAQQKRSDLKAAEEQVEAARKKLAAAHADRLPTINAEVDYGYIGVNPNNSYGTLDANGKISGPLFQEGLLRGEAKIADAQLQQARDRLNNLEGQVRADVKNAILDIQSAQKLVNVSRSNVDLAKEALSEAQERFKAGVSDNLAVSQAQSSSAAANEQYVSSLYQFNVAKLSLARATGVARAQYKIYLEGK